MVWSTGPTLFTARLFRDHILMPATVTSREQASHWSERWAAGLCPSPATMVTPFAPPLAIWMSVAVVPYLRICLENWKESDIQPSSKASSTHPFPPLTSESPSNWLHLPEHCFLLFGSDPWSHKRRYSVQRPVIRLPDMTYTKEAAAMIVPSRISF